MKIKSRGELLEIVNNKSIKTEVVKESKNKKLFHSIVYNKDNDQFYRVVWGEIKNSDKGSILHYNEVAEKVVLHDESGLFLTKEEIHNYNENHNKDIIKNEINDFVDNGESYDRLIFTSGLKNSFKHENEDNVKVVCGRTGVGKSFYVAREVAKAIKEKKNVLYFSTDENVTEVAKKIFLSMDETLYDKITDKTHKFTYEETDRLSKAQSVENVNVKIYYNNSLTDEYILRKMTEFVEEIGKLDLVVIDSLQMGASFNDRKGIVKAHEILDEYRQGFGCKMLVTTQINRIPVALS